MLYGQGSKNKLEYTKLLAAALAYVVVHQRDSVSLNVFDAGWRDRLPTRHFDFVPMWNIPVRFVYAPRRADCRRCGVTVEFMPWAVPAGRF